MSEDDKKKRQREADVAFLAEKLFISTQMSPEESFDAAARFVSLKESRWESLK